MIIAGDIACPTKALSRQLANIFDQHPAIFKGKAIVLNFEGLIGEEHLLQAGVPVLYNHAAVLESFHSFSTVTACLANNHILDLPGHFDNSISLLKQQQIHITGAGKSPEAAHEPASFTEGNHQVIVFNECWDFLLYHQKNPVGGIYIATIRFHQLAKRIEQQRRQHPNVRIVVYLHWSLDFETLPYPMYRQFAKDLVDAGADVIAGCHAHCVQGGEQYKQGYIVYGLGNFFLPNHVFAKGKLFFPSFAATQLVLEYDPETNKAFCHWFKYEKQAEQHSLQVLESGPFQSSDLLKEYSPYQGMEQKEYIHFFKKNRRKKVLIPLFKTYHNKRQLSALTNLLKTRATFARLLARVNIIKWGS